MSARYSRRAKLEQKKNLRKAILLTLFSLSLVSAVAFFGLPLIVKYADFITDLRNSEAPISKNDTTPPTIPRFDGLPDYTNQNKINVNGNAEPGTTLVLSVNTKTHDVLVNKSGRFSIQVNLSPGENTFLAYTKDTSGNESAKSGKIAVMLDTKSPEITIIKPENGSTFYGSKYKQLSIEGSTEEKAKVTVNEKSVVVKGDGRFTYYTTLNEGENVFTIKSEDRAGNATEESLTINFTQ